LADLVRVGASGARGSCAFFLYTHVATAVPHGWRVYTNLGFRV
jgi:hypothetical protein